MFQIAISILAVTVLYAMSFLANKQFGTYERLPMQWSWSGKVNWSAPRRLALLFTPILASIALVLTIITLKASGTSGPWIGWATVSSLSGGFIGAHALHLRLISWTLRR